jgi:PAS domain S-box-containing protein
MRVEHALAGVEERYRAVVDAVRDYAIVMLDLEGRVTHWSLGAQAVLGWAAERIAGQTFARCYGADDSAKTALRRHLDAAFLRGAFEAEGLFQRAGGGQFPARAVIKRLYEGGGQVTGYVVILRELRGAAPTG